MAERIILAQADTQRWFAALPVPPLLDQVQCGSGGRASEFDCGSARSIEFLKTLHTTRESIPLNATQASGPATLATLATLWAHSIDYLQADFIAPLRAQLDFSFVPLKIVRDKEVSLV